MPELSRPRPTSLNFFSTYRCNSRCLNCSIWQNEAPGRPEDELSSAELRELFADPLVQQMTDVGFAGGEPTLTPFMERALAELPGNKRVTVTTNALATARLLRVLDQPRPAGYCVQVSIDGLEVLNDRIRGVPGGFRKSVELLKELQRREVARVVSFTINRLNAGELEDVAELARSHGAVFTTRLAHAGGAYHNEEHRAQYDLSDEELGALEAALNRLIARELAGEHDPARLVFLKNIVPYARGQVQDPACYAMDTGIVLDCYGQVFPNCPFMMRSVGSLREASLLSIFKGGKANKARCCIDALRCGGCWNDCQIPLNLALAPEYLLSEYAGLRISHLTGESWDRMDWEGMGRELALLGYYGIEGEPGNRYRWTGERFSFLAPAGARELEFRAAPPPDTTESHPLELSLFLAGKMVGSIVYRSADYAESRIVLSMPAERMVSFEAVLNRSYCPRDAGQGDDARCLGIALRSLRFHA